ncbi:DHDH dehydrogenase, partial [Orthonyx spaldingii]|nr:DHDH dehydrogenase [Orthonyx spaldingii]
RWGICSAGAISHDFVVALKTLPPTEHTVVAVAARDLGRAQAFARRFGVPRAYGSYEELAEDPDVDVVYVGVVNPAHLPTGLLFLRRGRAVLMEKPMALCAREVAELVGAARERGVFLMERLGGDWGGWGALGATGRGLGGMGGTGSDWEGIGGDGGHWERLGGDWGGWGALGATGRGLGGMGGTGSDWEGIEGHFFPFSPLFLLFFPGVDESVVVTLEFPGKGLAALTFSMAAELPGGAALGGPRGWAELPSHMNCPTELLWGGRRELFPLPPPQEPLNFPHSTGLRYEAQHVRECLLQGLTESPEMPLAESEVIARLLDQAREQVGVGGP